VTLHSASPTWVLFSEPAIHTNVFLSSLGLAQGLACERTAFHIKTLTAGCSASSDLDLTRILKSFRRTSLNDPTQHESALSTSVAVIGHEYQPVEHGQLSGSHVRKFFS
jgi:hypothetical protein